MSRKTSDSEYGFQEDMTPYWVMCVLGLVLIAVVSFGLPYQHQKELEKQQTTIHK